MYNICQIYCDTDGLCVNVMPTKFIYTNGNEDGCCIHLINYPRFKTTKKRIRNHAIRIARLVKDLLRQQRVSVVFDDKTYMIGE